MGRVLFAGKGVGYNCTHLATELGTRVPILPTVQILHSCNWLNCPETTETPDFPNWGSFKHDGYYSIHFATELDTMVSICRRIVSPIGDRIGYNCIHFAPSVFLAQIENVAANIRSERT